MFTYNADGTTTVTDPLGSQRTVAFELSNGTYQPVSVTGERCVDCGGKWQSVSLDANGFPERSVSFEGHLTLYTFDDRGLERSRTEAVGTAQERTTTRI